MKNQLFFFLTFWLFALPARGQQGEDIPFPAIGTVKARHAHEIAASNWSVGGETMDRDYTTFKEWKDYLGPTGAKKVRLQAGWAKCEKEMGIYDFTWLDEIIDGVIAQGVEPWLQTSYGNPIYEGGGDIYLSGGFPTSEEALAAWDRWVAALADRYKGRVKIWEIWNESDLNVKNTSDAYAKLFVRTTEIIRSEIPDAVIYALSLAGPSNVEYVQNFMEYLKTYNKLHLVDAVTLHGYSYRPENNYGAYFRMQQMIQHYSDHIRIVQGELGAPSENQDYYALSKYPWTEMSQSKWLLRRLLGDLGHDIESLYFTMIDMNYIRRYKRVNGEVIELDEPIYTTNTKGLLKANKDNTVASVKPSYGAYQHITSIFDHRLERIRNYPYSVTTDSSLSVYAYQTKGFDYQAVTIWENGGPPSNEVTKRPVTFEFPAGNFVHPVYVEMRTGKVYRIPEDNWQRNGTTYTFKNIPIYDSPILIAEESLITIEE